jgi:hypothetical protein
LDAELIQLVSALPLPALIGVTLGVPLFLALLLGGMVQALFTPRELASNAEVGVAKYGFIVEVYAVVAALTLVGSWGIYQTAREDLRHESGALFMLASAVPTYASPEQAPQRAEMYAAIRAYAAAVAALDWPQMQRATNRSGSDEEFQRLARAFLDAEPVTAAQQALAQNVAGWLHQIADARIARLSANSRSFGALIWVLVLLVSVAVLVFQWFIGSTTAPVHYAMAGVIALIAGTVLAISVKLAFPFAGDPPFLSPAPFIQLMRVGL